VLIEQGAQRDVRLQSIMDALNRRRGNAAAAPAVGNSAALLSAIAANSYANNRKRNQGRS